VRDETRAIGVDSAGVEHANFCGELELFIRLASREYYNSFEHIHRLRGRASIVVSADMIVLFILSNYIVNYPSSSSRLKVFCCLYRSPLYDVPYTGKHVFFSTCLRVIQSCFMN
jgi:hypothetical protein